MPAPITDTQIAEAAYQIWLDEGQPVGRDLDHWLQAQAALSAKPKRKAPARKATSAKTKGAKPTKPKAVEARTTRARAKSKAGA